MRKRTISAPALEREINKTAASVDTVELFMRRPPRGLRMHLEAAQGERIIIEDCYDRTDRWQGIRVIVNRPNEAAIQVMARLIANRQLVSCVSRVDVAVDFCMTSEDSAIALAEWLDRHVILKWRSPRGRKRYWEGEGFWVLWGGGHQPRDVVVYTKAESTVRLELRFQSPAAVRRAGLDDLIDLENLDVRKLVRHNIKVEGLSDRYITNVVRKTIKDEAVRHRESARRRDHPFTDRYRSKIAVRVRRMLTQLDMQEVRPKRGVETIGIEWLSIPENPRLP